MMFRTGNSEHEMSHGMPLKFDTHVDIVYVLYGNTESYRKWPDGTYRNVMLVHVTRMSMVCFPIRL